MSHRHLSQATYCMCIPWRLYKSTEVQMQCQEHNLWWVYSYGPLQACLSEIQAQALSWGFLLNCRWCCSKNWLLLLTKVFIMDLKLQVMLARLRSEPSNLTTSMSDMADMETQNSTTVIITLTWPNKMSHLKCFWYWRIWMFNCSIAMLVYWTVLGSLDQFHKRTSHNQDHVNKSHAPCMNIDNIDLMVQN